MSEQVFERANQRFGASAHWCNITWLDASHESMVHQ